MVSNKRTGRIEPIQDIGDIHRFLPSLQRDVSIELFPVANLGSSEVTPEHWVAIAETITRLYDRFEGFVVIHGTNTMSFTAAALSFALQNLSKPIVLTGSLLPIDDIGSDARMNLIYAIETALLDLAEVCIVLGHRVLRGTRAKKADQSMIETFQSPMCPPLAEFNMTTTLAAHRLVRRKRHLISAPVFCTNVFSLTLHPGMPQSQLDAISSMRPDAVLLRAYGQGMLPESLFPWLQTLHALEIPLLITSQLLRASIDLHRFRKQLTMEMLGVISGKDMTFECAIVKLMWALGQSKNPRRVREIMERDIVGELTP